MFGNIRRKNRAFCLGTSGGFGSALVSVLVALQVGCHVLPVCCDPELVRRELNCRTGFAAQPIAPCQYVIPASVSFQDGLGEDEAIETALANNSAFQATLAQLGMAGGDAVQASLLANPQILMYFPIGPKEGQYTLFGPIESYLLRPARVKIANREYQRIGEQLVQNGLNLVRDVRLAHADWAVAAEQAKLSEEALAIREEILELTLKRLEDGDLSELETIAVKVDALNAKATQGIQQQNVGISQARLATLIGTPLVTEPLVPTPLARVSQLAVSEEDLVQQALACRPDLHAARWAVAAARHRAGLSRWLFLRLDGIVDVREGRDFDRTGSGLRFDIPIFNRNQGGVLRADWETTAALHARDAIHDIIVQDVRTAYRQLLQAQDNLTILESDVLPALNEALEIAKKGFADGGSDYLIVLQTTTQYLDARSRQLVQVAACRRALAELERSVGRCLDSPPIDSAKLLKDTAPANDSAKS